jgi:hypothetical protein
MLYLARGAGQANIKKTTSKTKVQKKKNYIKQKKGTPYKKQLNKKQKSKKGTFHEEQAKWQGWVGCS